MAVSYIGQLALQNGSALAWPGTQQVDDLAIAFAADKLSSVVPATPANWRLLAFGISQALGTGADGVDAGLVRVSVWAHQLTSATPPAPDFSAASASVIMTHGLLFRKGSSETWDAPVVAMGNRNTLSTAYSATSASKLGILIGDYVAAFSATTKNSAITSGRSSSVAGVTATQTPVTSGGSATGNHLYAWTDLLQVTGGAETAAPVAAATFGVTQAGGTVFVRVGVNRAQAVVRNTQPEQFATSRSWNQAALLPRNRSTITKVDGLSLDPVTGQIWPR